MNRDEIRDQFSPLLDGELAADERAEIEAMLSQDAELLRELDSLKRVDDLYRALPRPQTPDNFESAVSERIRPKVVSLKQRHARRNVWPLVAIAATLLVTAAFLVNRMQSASDSMQIASAPESYPASRPTESLPQGLAKDEATRASETTVEELQALGYTGDSAEMTAPAAAAAPERSDDVAKVALHDSAPMPEASAGVAADSVVMPAPPPASEAAPEQAAPAIAGVEIREMKTEAEAEAPTPAAEPEPLPSEEREIRTSRGREMSVSAPASPPPPAPADQAVGQAMSAPSKNSEASERAPAPRKQQSDAAATSAGRPERSMPFLPPVLRLSNRVFELREGAFYERGYKTEAVTPLVRGTADASEVLKAHAEFAEVFAAKETIVFKAGDTWYRLRTQD